VISSTAKVTPDMQISHQYKFIFFSFPKTGSESVRALLEPYSDIHGIPYWVRTEEHPFYSHISPAEVKYLFEQRGWDYENYYKFTFIRNPWARMVSLYYMIYHTNPPNNLFGRLRYRFRSHNAPSFKEWLRSTRPDGPGAGGPPDQRWQVYGSYSIASYILDKNGRDLVDEVLKLEEINQRLPELLERIGIPDAKDLAIPFVNKRASKNYREYYDAEADKLIRTRYRYDIDRFVYSFDN
jgi:hypothetical protein